MLSIRATMRKPSTYIIFLFATLIYTACNRSENTEEKRTGETETPVVDDKTRISGYIEDLPTQPLPYYDSSGFANSSADDFLPSAWTRTLGLKELYPYDIEQVESIWISHKLDFSGDFITLVIQFYPNDNEFFTMMATFSKEYQLIDFERIAYDEVAEGCFKTESLVDVDKILVYSSDFCYQETTDTAAYKLSEIGKFIAISLE